MSARRLIAADVGGTHARLALIDGAGERVALAHYERYACADFPSLAALLRRYIDGLGEGASVDAAVAIAGVLDGDRLINTNLPWPVSSSQTRRDAGLGRLHLINDFEALAWAAPAIDEIDTRLLCGPARPTLTGPIVLIGPGTGLGAALCFRGPPLTVLPTEAGHQALAVGTPRELAVLAILMRRWPHVDVERALSGPGLVNLYVAIAELDGVAAQHASPAAIVTATRSGDPHAAEALGMFCALLGSFAGDLATTFGASEVYVAGGVAEHIGDDLASGAFAERFLNKGVLRERLARVTVRLVDHGSLGVAGAAHWHRQHTSNEKSTRIST
jgi:glucokinase